jgi:hypothetical protein
MYQTQYRQRNKKKARKKEIREEGERKPGQSSCLVTSYGIHGPNSILLIYSLFASKCVIMIVTLTLLVL